MFYNPTANRRASESLANIRSGLARCPPGRHRNQIESLRIALDSRIACIRVAQTFLSVLFLILSRSCDRLLTVCLRRRLQGYPVEGLAMTLFQDLQFAL